MNHLNQDESPDWDDDIDAFENQLRSLRPTPPSRSWSALAETIETSLDQTPAHFNISPVLRMSVWTPIASHSITAAIGLAVGVAVMLMQPFSDPGLIDNIDHSNISNAPIQLVDDQATDKGQPITLDLETPDPVLVTNRTFPDRHRQAKLNRRSDRLSQASLGSTTLRVFGSTDERLVNGRDWLMEPVRDHGYSQREDSDADDTQFDHQPIDKPVLSPGAFRQVLDELTYLPTTDKPFSRSFDGGWKPPLRSGGFQSPRNTVWQPQFTTKFREESFLKAEGFSS